MNWLSKFLTLRKRHDSIKFSLILLVCAAYFVGNGIIQIVSYVGYLKQPVEYILEAYSTSASLDVGIDKLKEITGVIGASFQRDYIIISENNTVITVSDFSAEYLSECYGIESFGSSEKIWMNSVAYDEFVGKTDQTSVRMSYTIDGKTETAEIIKCNELVSDTAFAVRAGTTASLDNSRIVRVKLDNANVIGTDVRRIEKLGYEIINREDMLIRSHEQEMILSDIKECIITTVLSVIGGYAFIKIYKLSCKQ